MNNSNICILILSTQAESYKVFIEAIQNSWFKDATDKGFRVFFYSGGHEDNYIYNNSEIRVTEDDSIHNCYRKFVSAKEVLIASFPEIEVIYRTNLSSYIDVATFSKYINKCSFEIYSYHGLQGEANLWSEIFYKNKLIHLAFKYLKLGPEIKFFSGAGFFIGIELCNSLSFDDSKNYLIDDVEIGRQLQSFKNHDVNYERIHITDSYFKLKKEKLSYLINNGLLFHYKFKTSDRSEDAANIARFSNVELRNKFLTI